MVLVSFTCPFFLALLISKLEEGDEVTLQKDAEARARNADVEHKRQMRFS